VPEKIQPIKNFIADCIKMEGEKAILDLSKKGGYYSISNEIPNINGTIPYYIFNNKSYVITKRQLELEFSEYIKDNLPNCLGNFSDFSEFKISKNGESIVNTTINAEDISIDVTYSIIINQDEDTYALKDFDNLVVISRIGTIQNLAERIIQEQLSHTGSICLTCLSDMGTIDDVYIEITPYENISNIFTLKDNQLNSSQVYEYTFAIENE
jgi:hypothetical protein